MSLKDIYYTEDFLFKRTQYYKKMTDKETGISDRYLWDNPMVTAAKNSMSDEQIAAYKKEGEYVFSNNFEVTENISNMPESSVDALAYIRESLKSGQHPSTLESSEKALLFDAHGDDWLAEFGYSNGDLDSIVTLSM
jgi:hypothetical protein